LPLRPDISAAHAAGLTGELVLDVRQPDIIRPSIAAVRVGYSSLFVRYPSMALHASSASEKDSKGEPPTLTAHLIGWIGRHDATKPYVRGLEILRP
jgi:hypothetical protein